MTSLTCGEDFNFFQPTGFRVVINSKYYRNLQFFTTKINHPGAQNSADETPFRRIGSVPFPGNTMTYGELSMDVLLDADFVAYQEMYDWMLRLVNEEQIAEQSDEPNRIPTYADIHVHALTPHNNPNVMMKYVDCLPVSVGDIQFDAQNQSVEYVVFPVSFRFSYFTVEVDTSGRGEDPRGTYTHG